MTIREIYKNSEQFLNKEVKLGGWIRSIRGSKHFGFLVLHDGTFFKPIQVVYEEKLENFQEISKMNVGAAVIVEGTLVPTPQAKQPFEIQAATVTLEGASAPDYPLQKKRHSLEYLRTISHLRQEQIHSRQCSVSVLWQRMRFTSFLRRGDLFMFIHRSLQQVTVKEREKCSRLQLLI